MDRSVVARPLEVVELPHRVMGRGVDMQAGLVQEEDAVGVGALGLHQEHEVEGEEVLETLAALVHLDLAGVQVVGHPDSEVLALEVVAELVPPLLSPIAETLGPMGIPWPEPRPDRE